MFIPLHDANSLRHIKLQYVTIALIVVNVLAFLLTAMQPQNTVYAEMIGLAYIPYYAFSPETLPEPYHSVPELATYVTYSFLHGDIFHIGGNMLFLWVFGDNVEDALGHVKFLIFYLLCAAAGALMHGIVAPNSQVPLIGASGAIAGIVAAYLILHPRVKVWILAFGRIPLRIPAWMTLALWIGFQFFMFISSFNSEEEQVSWSAHIGGILAGLVLVFILKRRDVPLFDRELVTPRAVRIEQQSAVAPVETQPPSRWGRQ